MVELGFVGSRSAHPSILHRMTLSLVERVIVAPGHQDRLKPAFGGVDLRALDGRGGIYVLGTHDTALSDKGAVPDAIVVAEDRALLFALIARVHVIAVAEGDGGRAQKVRLEPVNRAGRVAEHAVDALRELVERLELRRRLSILALTDGFFFLANDPRFHALQLVQEITHVDDQMSYAVFCL